MKFSETFFKITFSFFLLFGKITDKQSQRESGDSFCRFLNIRRIVEQMVFMASLEKFLKEG